jgi:uncharacterized protein (DUF1501 family)
MEKQISRRDFLKISSSSIAAIILGAPTISHRFVNQRKAPNPNSDILITIFMRGGMDGLNVIIPQFEDQYYVKRPTIAIPESSNQSESSAINLDNRFGMHPSLSPLMEIWEDDKLAIIHGVGSPDPTHSHFDAQDFIERATPGDKTISTGWIARYLESITTDNTSPFRAVGLNGKMPTSLRGSIPATTLQTIEDFKLHAETEYIPHLQETLLSLYNLSPNLSSPAQVTLEAVDTLANINPENYKPSNNAQYPETKFGNALLQIAQLIKSEVGLEVAAVDLMGFDTHTNENTTLKRLLDEFSKGLLAFYQDMNDMMKNITIVAMSEFGRRVEENGNQGTDHGHGGVMFTIGGGVNGGKIYTNWIGLSPENLYGPGDLAVTTDFRDVLGELVSKRLNYEENLENIFPNYHPEYLELFQKHA